MNVRGLHLNMALLYLSDKVIRHFACRGIFRVAETTPEKLIAGAAKLYYEHSLVTIEMLGWTTMVSFGGFATVASGSNDRLEKVMPWVLALSAGMIVATPIVAMALPGVRLFRSLQTGATSQSRLHILNLGHS